jgi:hypothetical protein
LNSMNIFIVLCFSDCLMFISKNSEGTNHQAGQSPLLRKIFIHAAETVG